MFILVLKYRGQLTEVRQFMSAPCSRRNSPASTCPMYAVIIKLLQPICGSEEGREGNLKGIKRGMQGGGGSQGGGGGGGREGGRRGQGSRREGGGGGGGKEVGLKIGLTEITYFPHNIML